MTLVRERIVLERRGAVAWLTLSRPEQGNAIDAAMAEALLEAGTMCAEDAAVRCVVLTGAGRMFCAGGDIFAFAANRGRLAELVTHVTGHMHPAVSVFARMGKPLVTAINGPAAGAGLSFALLGDIALAARSAKLSVAYAGIGLSPDGGASWLLPRLVGMRRAQELLLLNRQVTADEAAAMGLITRAVDDAALLAEAEAVAMKLAAGPVRALARARALLLESFGATLERQMEDEVAAMRQSAADAEAQEGITAFLEKRAPMFAPPTERA